MHVEEDTLLKSLKEQIHSYFALYFLVVGFHPNLHRAELQLGLRDILQADYNPNLRGTFTLTELKLVFVGADWQSSGKGRIQVLASGQDDCKINPTANM